MTAVARHGFDVFVQLIEQRVLQEEFEEYAAKAKTLPDTTTNDNLLILYGLYKQATVGPVNTGECLC